ncbi:MAG: hypothetical protein JEZ08_03450 [Clostridiales bacterium]|nr:hypothetical protein [Clostridiales bacterium]
MRRVPIDKSQNDTKHGNSLYNSEGKILLSQESDLGTHKRTRLNQLFFTLFIEQMF